jgi:hypothetical protein
MADVIKVLGQLNPAATTLTTLYTVPTATSATASSIAICNEAAVAGTFRVSIAVAGAADNVKQYLYYDQALYANDTFIATIGITLGAGDVVRAYASSATMAFSLFGLERG